jgi:membrane protein DedA with SNARE-associated domain
VNVEPLITALGYGAPFAGVALESLGIPVPGETVLIAAAALAGRGDLSPAAVAAAGLAGAVVGDNIGYGIGRRWGAVLVRSPRLRRLYPPERVGRVETFFRRRRGWAVVVLGRFVAILRMLAGPVAGAHGMRWRTFLIANAVGGILWVTYVTTVGILIGRGTAEPGLSGWWVSATAGVILAAAASGLFLVRRLGRDQCAGHGTPRPSGSVSDATADPIVAE